MTSTKRQDTRAIRAAGLALLGWAAGLLPAEAQSSTAPTAGPIDGQATAPADPAAALRPASPRRGDAPVPFAGGPPPAVPGPRTAGPKPDASTP